MSSVDRINRARWARDQKAMARARFAATIQPEQERAERLATLQALADAMEGQPHMAPTLAAVRAEIARLT